MYKFYWNKLLLILLLALAAYGQEEEQKQEDEQEQKRLAILRTVDDGDPPVELTDLNYLTVRLREIAGNVLQNHYGIMTEQSIIDKLGKDNAVKACKETEGCLAQLGRRINADYIGQARLGRFGGNLTISVELYNSASGLQASPAISGQAENVSGLLAILNEKAPGMFGKMPDIIYEPAPVPVPVPDDAVPKMEKSIKTSFWVALALDVLGATIIYLGYDQDKEMMKSYDKYKVSGQSTAYYNEAWEGVENGRSRRNMFYIIGGAVLASGIGVHIWF